MVAGAVLGILVALTSVGAGALGAVFLAYLYPLRLTPPRLIATDIVHAIPLALFAGAGHLLMGQFSLSLLSNLLIGSVPAVILGAMISVRLPHVWLRAALGIVLGAYLMNFRRNGFLSRTKSPSRRLGFKFFTFHRYLSTNLGTAHPAKLILQFINRSKANIICSV